MSSAARAVEAAPLRHHQRPASLTLVTRPGSSAGCAPSAFGQGGDAGRWGGGATTGSGGSAVCVQVLGFLVPPGAGERGVPLQTLFGFERVHVKAGQTVMVRKGERFRPIFPEGDDPWWLTDVSRRAMDGDDNKAEADEDGPPASDLEEEKQVEVSDSDAESENGADAHSHGAIEAGAGSSSHEPFVAWRS